MEPVVPTDVHKTGGQQVYHTDPACQAYQQIVNDRPLRPGEKEEMTECRYCTGEAESRQSGSMAYYRAAVDADPQEASE
jgi:hypothetical protein